MRFSRFVVLALLSGCAAQGMEQGSYGGRPLGAMMMQGAPQQRPAQQGGGQSLFSASARGDVSTVDSLLAQGAGVNARNPNGATALQLAASGGHLDVVQTLIANGADVNAQDNEGTTPLVAASEGGYPDVVRALRAAGAGGKGGKSKSSEDQGGGEWWKSR